MSTGSQDLLGALTRFARAVSKAAAREGPRARRAAGRIVKEELPVWSRHAKESAGKAVKDLRKRMR